jgi:hypothetical protein
MSTYVLRHRTSRIYATHIGSDTDHGIPVVQSFIGGTELTFDSEFRAIVASGADPEWEAVRV